MFCFKLMQYTTKVNIWSKMWVRERKVLLWPQTKAFLFAVNQYHNVVTNCRSLNIVSLGVVRRYGSSGCSKTTIHHNKRHQKLASFVSKYGFQFTTIDEHVILKSVLIQKITALALFSLIAWTDWRCGYSLLSFYKAEKLLKSQFYFWTCLESEHLALTCKNSKCISGSQRKTLILPSCKF